MIRNLVSLLIITGLTLAFLLFWGSSPEELLGIETKKSQLQAEARHPTNIIFNHSSQHYDENGSLSYIFTSEEVRHFQINRKRQSDKDFTEITKPELIMYRENGPPWEVQADKGHTTKQGSVITMIDNVKIWQTNTAGMKSELTTSKLTVMPDKQYAKTDKPVKLVAPDSVTRAIGMQAHLKEDQIKLLSRVRGLYEAL
jgi:lipopolysaccharide export system protein LptC